MAARRRERVFYIVVAVVAAALVYAGFARTFFLRPYFAFADQPLPMLRVVHGIIFTTWFVLLLVQTSLVAAGRTDLHRRLGIAGIALAALMVVVGALTAVDATRRGFAAEGT